MLVTLALLVIAGIGAVFYYSNNVEGDLVGDGNGTESCEPDWFTPTHPDSGDPYTSKDALREDVASASPEWNETQIEDYMSNAELRDTENRTQEIVQLQEGCM